MIANGKMRKFPVTIRVLLASLLICAAAHPEDKRNQFVVRGPTILAFFPDVTQEQVDNSPELTETLSDFQWYAYTAAEPLKKAGIVFHQVYAASFQIRLGARLINFRPKQPDIAGYYFIAPGKKPRTEYGVLTHIDLFQIAQEYFHISVHETETK